jgi:glycosyltransferase involved in cell wall biosynthesis
VIYEALSYGCPVIVSDQTPWTGLEQKEIGWDIQLSNKFKFTEVLNTCISMDIKSYSKMSENAFLFAREYADKDTAVTDTIKMFNS